MAAKKVPTLLFKKPWVDFLREEFELNPVMTMRVFFAIVDYAYEGMVPEDINIRMATGSIRKEIDEAHDAYNEISEKRRNIRLNEVRVKKERAIFDDFDDENEQEPVTSVTSVQDATSVTSVTNIMYNNNSNTTTNVGSNNTKLNNKKTKAKKVEPLTDEEQAFVNDMKDKFPRIIKMKEPITLYQYDELLCSFGEPLVLSVMEKLNNYAKINNYVSAKATLNNWCKMELERNGNNRANNQASAKPSLHESIFNDIVGSQSAT